MILETLRDSFNKIERGTVKKIDLTHAYPGNPSTLSTGMQKTEENCGLRLCINSFSHPPPIAPLALVSNVKRGHKSHHFDTLEAAFGRNEGATGCK